MSLPASNPCKDYTLNIYLWRVECPYCGYGYRFTMNENQMPKALDWSYVGYSCRRCQCACCGHTYFAILKPLQCIVCSNRCGSKQVLAVNEVI